MPLAALNWKRGLLRLWAVVVTARGTNCYASTVRNITAHEAAA
ncbi:MAG: hypothetical protein RL274_2420 [Pseudomonadota bacterium]|jgi:hypothetical protein